MGSRIRAWWGWAAVLAAIVSAAVALGPAAAQDPGSDAGAAVDSAAGRQLYDTNCATCHGGDARGGVVPGTDLRAPALAGLSAAYVDLVVRTGRMPPAGDPLDNRVRRVLLDDEERATLVGWMTEAFDLEPGLPEPGEGDVAQGLQVFALNCAACHGNAGGGGVAGRGAWTPKINDSDAQTVLEAIRVGPFEMPRFSTDQISEEEADSVVAYLEAVGQESGTVILGLVEMDPVTASGMVVAFVLVLVLSLFYIAGRATTFPERSPAAEQPGAEEEDDDP